jgi:hypothetical protein
MHEHRFIFFTFRLRDALPLGSLLPHCPHSFLLYFVQISVDLNICHTVENLSSRKWMATLRTPRARTFAPHARLAPSMSSTDLRAQKKRWGLGGGGLEALSRRHCINEIDLVPVIQPLIFLASPTRTGVRYPDLRSLEK